MGMLLGLSTLFFLISSSLFCMEPFLGQTLNSLVLEQQIQTITTATSTTNSTESVAHMSLQAYPTSLFLKWGFYPIYWPVGMFMFKAMEWAFYLSMFFLVLHAINNYSLNKGKREIDELFGSKLQ